MKKRYLNPSIEAIVISEAEMIAGGPSMQIGSSEQKVSNSSDIGFVKEQSSSSYDVWNDDWSK